MNNHLCAALRIARLRWAPNVLYKPSRVPPWCADSLLHVQGPFRASGWVAPSNLGILWRLYSAAPIRSEGETLLDDEEDEVDRKVKQMERRREVRAAQKAFMEYLHVTRGMCFSHAEHISKRSPVYLSKLLEEVKDAVKEPEEGG